MVARLAGNGPVWNRTVSVRHLAGLEASWPQSDHGGDEKPFSCSETAWIICSVDEKPIGGLDVVPGKQAAQDCEPLIAGSSFPGVAPPGVAGVGSGESFGVTGAFSRAGGRSAESGVAGCLMIGSSAESPA